MNIDMRADKRAAAMQVWLRRRTLLGAVVGMVGCLTTGRGATCGAGAGPTASRDDAPVSDFLRMLAFVPAPLDCWQRTLSYAAPGLVKARYGLGDLQSYADLVARGLSTARFASYFGGCWSSPFAYNGLSVDGSERDAFGFDFYQVACDLCAGEPPAFLSTQTGWDRPPAFGRIEGAFDAAACAAALRSGGYLTADYGDDTYFTTLGDGETDLTNIRSRLFPARRDRLAADAARVIVTPATAIMQVALDAERGRVPTLDVDPTLRALAAALGDATSIVTLPPDYADRTIAATRARSRSSVGTAQVIAQGLRARAAGWSMLHVPDLLAFAVTDAGGYARTLHLALVYADPANAAADAPEVAARLATYRVPSGGGWALAAGTDLFTPRTETYEGRGVIVADAPLLTMPNLNPAWVQSTVSSLIPFIALQDPAATIRGLEADAATPTPGGAPTP